MLVTMSEQQTLTNQLQQHEGDPTKVRLLRLRDATDEPFGAGCFIREADAFSGHPEDLVRDHALCLGKGKKKSWFFCSLAKYDDSPDGPRRKLNAGNGAGDMCRWNVEVGNSQILGSDKTPLGANRRTLSYVLKIENPPNSKRKYRQKSLGWKMIEIGLEQHQAGKQLLLCEVYNSRQACSLPGGDDPSSAPPRPQLSSSSPSRPRPPQPSSSPWAPPPPPQSSWSQPSLNLSLSPPSSSLPQPPSYLSSRLRSSPSPSPPLSPPSSPHPLLGPSCDSKELKFETKLEYDLDWQPGSISPELKHARCWPMGGRRSGCGVAIVKKTSVAPATLVMKFGGSLTQSADGVKKVANLISSFPDGGSENPVVVLSAIGNTNVNLLVAAGKALSCDPQEANAIHELVITKELHLRMIHDLGLDRSIISGLFRELENIFMDITETKEMTAKTRDHLGSFGEGMSTIIVSAYLNKLGEEAGQEWKSDDVNTCGGGGSDLTMTTIGRELGSREIQVWKDVDGVLTCDPKVCGNAKPVPYLTFDEADELGLFDPKSMQPAMEGGIPIIVKNLFNPQAPGTVITKRKGMSKSVLTSIVLRSNILVLNIESTRKLDQPVFIGTSFSTLGNLGIYVDCVDISEGRISLIVVPPKHSSHELVHQELDNVVEELQKFAVVTHLYRSVIMLIGSNTQMSSNILVKAVNVLRSNNVEVQKFSQGSSEVMKVSLVVDTNKGEDCVRALHSAFFENSPAAAACSGDKRRADDEHPEAPPGVRQELTDADGCFLQEFERGLLSENNDPMPVGADNLGHHYKMLEDIINECRRESSGVDDDRDLADVFAGIPPIVAVEDDLPEPIGVGDGGDFTGMPLTVDDYLLQEPTGVHHGGDSAGMPLTVDDYLPEPLGRRRQRLGHSCVWR